MTDHQEEDELTKMANVFSALGNPLRLIILNIVASSNRPLHIKAISKITKTRYTLTYKHVKTLEKAGLVSIYEVGRSRVLALKSPELFGKIIELGRDILKGK